MVLNKIIEEQHSNATTAAFQAGKNGNAVCGDMFITVENERYFLAALADGLGSGKGLASLRRLQWISSNRNSMHRWKIYLLS
ncbi:hypothetical protein [Geomicrobium sp. JCM 19037]|uniref:hypothetical protein n=1 Tax=Geomicrobium sp. JCM 19037 TaxID=1460634 RepID=UPI00126926E4|nr:hypothetical protein [Geomicrobium sp. JCM 19037]